MRRRYPSLGRAAAKHDAKTAASHFLELAEGAYRAPDPFLISHEGFIFRRLSPDARKLDLEQGVPAGLEALFLRAMGIELGALHAADKNSAAIPDHLAGLPKSWLADASKAAASSVKSDFKEWRQATKPKDDSADSEKAAAAA